MVSMRSFRLFVLGVACLAVVPTSTALATTKAPTRPTVRSIAPLPLGIGDTLTIRGRNFLAGKKRNSVAFKRDGSPAVTVKAGLATRTRMKVVVPATLAQYLTVTAGVPRPTRFRVRVLSRRFSKGYTALKSSPIIRPANGAPGGGLDEFDEPQDGCDAGGIVESVDGEGDDNALLSDTLEAAIESDPCSVDAVGDGLQDDGT
jgi:hypothetical protein